MAPAGRALRLTLVVASVPYARAVIYADCEHLTATRTDLAPEGKWCWNIEPLPEVVSQRSDPPP